MPVPSESTKTLARFLTQSDHFNRANHCVKERAFLPDSHLELSVFQIDGLEEIHIWELCTRKPIYGRGDLNSLAPINLKLQVVFDNTVYRHANIVGWPAAKHEQKSLAQQLAAEATLYLRQE